MYFDNLTKVSIPMIHILTITWEFRIILQNIWIFDMCFDNDLGMQNYLTKY